MSSTWNKAGLFVSVIICSLACAFLIPQAHGGKVKLAQNGTPLAVIVLPDEPGDTEEFAASELMSYIEKITGAELPVKSESERDDETFISVGRTRLSESARERLAGEPADAFVIESVSNGIILAGGGDSGRSPGTLFSVYDFLEHDLGCRWLGPGELWEHVPEQAVLDVTAADRLESPAFIYRSSQNWPGWATKNKANQDVFGTNIKWPFDWIAERSRGHEPPVFDVLGWGSAHSVNRFLPVCSRGDPVLRRKMLTVYPEWFTLRREGRNYRWWCYLNPELNDLLADRMSQMFRERPHKHYISLGENDGYGAGLCHCDACLDVEAELGGTHETHRGIWTFRWRLWENCVAGMLAETDPGKKLLGVAYGGAQEPLDPDLVRPADNVMIEYYTWANCRAHGYEHDVEDESRLPEALPHAESRDWIERWAEMTPAGMIMAEYVSRASMQGITVPTPRRFVRDMRYLRDRGFIGYRAFSGHVAWSLYTLNRYAVLKASWNPDIDADELVRDYCDHAFHEASEHMQRFISTIEKAVEAGGCDHCRIVAWALDSEAVDEALRHLDAAIAASADNEIVRERLLSWDVHFRYAALASPGIFKYVRGGFQTSDAEMLRQGLAQIQEAVDYIYAWRDEYGVTDMSREDRRALTQRRPDLALLLFLGTPQRRYLAPGGRYERLLERIEQEN